MSRFDLSAWALRNRSVVAYLMVLAVAAGIVAFFELGRNEDPAFTIKTMVVSAAWPGATLEETLDQVTERIERKVQELEGLKVVRSFTRAGQATVYVDLEGAVRSADVPKAWQRVRNDIADIWPRMPQGVLGPFFNDRFGDVFGIIWGFTADGFSHRELRDRVEAIRSELLRVPDVAKIELLGARDEVVFLEFSMRQLASLQLDRQALLNAIAQQNLVRPAGIVETGDERIALRVTGRSATNATSSTSPSTPADGGCGSATSPRSAAGSPIRRSRSSGSAASPPSGSRSPCARAATS